jgi:thiosulfate reductase cytochrome b subunit
MADTAWVPGLASAVPAATATPRHSAIVRLTHWLTAICFLALLVSGIEIVVSHPRFYWGETGNVLSAPLFQLPIPASRGAVKTGYGFVLPDQNGWSRALHFQTAWALVFTGIVYLLAGVVSGHFRKSLLPAAADLSWQSLSKEVANHVRFKPPSESEERSYNVLQRLTYLIVIFVVFPLMIWTGLAMSPGFTSAVPFTVSVFGGQQSARTIHFFITLFLLLFLLVHIVMVYVAGFRRRMRAMITGQSSAD